jgi:hypothetical protein
MVSDVVISLPGGGETDALHLAIEHHSGYCQDFYHPYERAPDGAIRFLEPLSRPRRGTVFASCGKG